MHYHWDWYDKLGQVKRMSARTRWVGAAIGVAVLVVALDAAVRSIGMGAVRARVDSELSRATGLDIRIGEDFHLELLPQLQLEAREITAIDPNAKTDHPLLRIGVLELELALWPLLRGHIEIRSLGLVRTELNLVASDDGDAHVEDDFEIEDLAVLADDAPSAQLFDFELHELHVKDLRIAYRDADGEPIAQVWISEGIVESESLGSPIEFEFEGSFAGSEIALDGTLGPLSQLFHPDGPFPIDLELSSPDTAAVDDLELRFAARGTLGDIGTLQGLSVEVTLQTENPWLPIDYARLALPPIEEIIARARIFESHGHLAAEGSVAVSALGGDLRLEIGGLHPDLTSVRDTRLQVSGSARDWALLETILPIAGSAPAVGPVELSASLSGEAEVLNVADLVLRVGSADATGAEVLGSFGISVAGGLPTGGLEAWRTRVERVDLRFRARVPDLPWIGRVASLETPLPNLGPVEVSGRLRGSGASLAVEEIVARVGTAEATRVEVTGRFALAPPSSTSETPPEPLVPGLSILGEIDLRVAGHAADLTAIGELLSLDWPLPGLAPADLTGRIRRRNGAIGLEDLAVRLGTRGGSWLEVDGSVADLERLVGVQAEARFHAADLELAKPYLAFEPPDVGPIRGGVTLSDRDGTLGIEELHVAGGREGFFEFELSSAFDDLFEMDEIAVRASLQAANLRVVGRVFGIDLPAVARVAFNGVVNGSDEKIESHGQLRLDQTLIDGDWSGSFAPDTRPTLQARIHSPWIQLDDLGIEPLPDDGQDEEGTIAALWSSTERLPFERLRDLDADLELIVDRVTGIGDLELGRVRSRLRLDHGDLVFEQEASGKVMGELRGEVHLDVRGDEPVVEVRIHLDGIDLDRLLSQIAEGHGSGLLDAEIELLTHGWAPDELRSNLKGAFGLVVRDGTLASRYGREFVRDFVRVSIPSLGGRQATSFGCIVAAFDVEEGIATAQSLFLESDKIMVTGTGTIDIRNDAFDLVLKPQSLEPGVLSVSATVLVKGPLADPVFKPKLRSVAGHVARGLAKNLLRPTLALLTPFRSKNALSILCEQGLD